MKSKLTLLVSSLLMTSFLAACNNEMDEAQRNNNIMNVDDVLFDGSNEQRSHFQTDNNHRFQIALDPESQNQYPNLRKNPTLNNRFQQEEQQDRNETSIATEGNMQQEVIRLTNIEREKQGLTNLAADMELAQVAQAKSEDMAAKNYFSHNSPTYGSPFDMMKSFGIEYQSAAENIAAGQQSAEAVVEGWMNSPGHRKNILNKNLTHIGIGYSPDGNYWTQMFIKK